MEGPQELQATIENNVQESATYRKSENLKHHEVEFFEWLQGQAKLAGATRITEGPGEHDKVEKTELGLKGDIEGEHKKYVFSQYTRWEKKQRINEATLTETTEGEENPTTIHFKRIKHYNINKNDVVFEVTSPRLSHHNQSFNREIVKGMMNYLRDFQPDSEATKRTEEEAIAKAGGRDISIENTGMRIRIGKASKFGAPSTPIV